MQKVKGIKLACLAAFAILPVQAYALGVGKLTMHSALDEPLSATIELTAATTAELQTLEVVLGSVGVFHMAGIDRSEQLTSISFTLVKVNGKDVIKLHTEQPFRDPFLHFIVKATWANGSMLREYTALLDPPSYLTGAPAHIQAPAVAKPVAVKSTAKPSPEKKAAVASTAVDTSVAQIDAAERKLGPTDLDSSAGGSYSDLRPGGSYGPVKNGDSLWNIAEEVKAGTGLGIAQVMMAIYKQNPDAFLHNNINLIRVGKTLEIPTDEVISSTSRTVAQAEMRAQMEEWQEYKATTSGGTRMASADAVKESPASASTADTSEKESTATASKADMMPEAKEAAAGTDDVLEIVRAKVEGTETSGMGVSADEKMKYESAIEAYKENVSQLEETLESSDLEKDDLIERVALLEQQIDKANRLIDIQKSDLARLQGQAQEQMQEQTAEVTPVEPAMDTEKTEVTPVSPIEPVAETESAHLSAPDITPVAPVTPEIKKPEVVKKPAVVVAKKKEVKVRARPQPVEEKGMLDTAKDIIFSSWITMLGTGLALLLILVGIFVVLRRRRSIAEFEDSIISGTAVLDISTAESTEPSDSGSETSFLSDFVPGMGNMQADEVDPLAEAEVYMAYGRDEQAEEVLKEAAGKNPDRHELKLKLLEIYQSRKDVSSFETLAEELYPADGNIPMNVWAKVVEMGKIVNPDNPLFQGDLKLQEETLFGDKDRKEDVPLSDLLDTDTVETEEANLMDALNKDEEPEDITEEITEESFVETDEMEVIEGFELPVEEKADNETAESSDTKGDDFPEPDEEVLNLDLGDFTPDEAHETNSFDLDSLELNLAELEGDTEESDETSEESIDFNLDGIDLELDDTSESEGSIAEITDIEGIEDLDLDLGSEENVSDTAEVSIQDETLEFADLGDLALDESDSGLGGSDIGTVDESAEMPAGANETWDEAGTKLDLARAYIEMDDKDSAQSILEEVAKEGTDNQKNEARDLLNQISAG
ncbi:MAG: FimV/HubP family polar landmark protein [Pseudomonadota bacterium]|nr:FimV/HubP family polar landmark protein [Pseudomonadota bacterium]